MTAGACPLSEREQTRNVLIVGVNTALCYLASPVLYVDAVHTSLMNDLQGANPLASWSNMPSSAYLAFAVMPLFVAWYFPQIRLLRTILVLCYFALAVSNAAVAGLLLSDVPPAVKEWAVIGHGGLVGTFRTVSVAFEFEVLGVAVAESRRGLALGIGYGFGPILAVFANLLTQLFLAGKIGPLSVGDYVFFPLLQMSERLEFPAKFVAVFACTAPVMLLAAVLCTRLTIPVPSHEAERLPFLAGTFGGIGKFLSHRVTLIAIVSTLLIHCGYTVIGNLTLYTGALFGSSPSESAGYQKAVLYTFKVMMGISMGWVLSWAAPRSAVLISATAGLTAITLAIFAPASIILLCFGFLGGGQLHGVYATNYILSCATKELMRKYMAFCMVAMLPSAPFGAIFGAISDHFGSEYGKLAGYQISFGVASGLIFIGMAMVLVLPARPKPEGEPSGLAAGDMGIRAGEPPARRGDFEEHDTR